MKIRIHARSFFEARCGTQKEEELLAQYRIISINSPMFKERPPFRNGFLAAPNLLILHFNDVDGADCADAISANDAEKIVSFVQRTDNRPLLIHCTAGISRSGAVGEVLNWYYHRFLHCDDIKFKRFYEVNPDIEPNQHVIRVLWSCFEKQLPEFAKVGAGCMIGAYCAETAWKNLSWSELLIDKEHLQFRWGGVPTVPGIYKVTFTSSFGACVTLNDCSDKGIRIFFRKGDVLSIGKTTNIKNRLQQHFSQSNSNRLGKALLPFRKALPFDLGAIGKLGKNIGRRELAQWIYKGYIKVEFVTIPNWWERHLLETYGQAFCKSVLDFDMEH